MNHSVHGNLSHTVVVWDKFIRFFHWNIASGFFLDYLVIEDSNPLHQWLGYYLLSLLVVRIVWGFTGTYHARFQNFVPGFNTLQCYMVSMIKLKEPDFKGHNPAGAIMIIAILFLFLIICVTGWMMGLDMFWGAGWVENIHYYASTTLFYGVFVHVAGVLYACWRHKTNLIKSMITGKK